MIDMFKYVFIFVGIAGCRLYSNVFAVVCSTGGSWRLAVESWCCHLYFQWILVICYVYKIYELLYLLKLPLFR